jgi:hypothetical protein
MLVSNLLKRILLKLTNESRECKSDSESFGVFATLPGWLTRLNVIYLQCRLWYHSDKNLIKESKYLQGKRYKYKLLIKLWLDVKTMHSDHMMRLNKSF